MRLLVVVLSNFSDSFATSWQYFVVISQRNFFLDLWVFFANHSFSDALCSITSLQWTELKTNVLQARAWSHVAQTCDENRTMSIICRGSKKCWCRTGWKLKERQAAQEYLASTAAKHKEQSSLIKGDQVLIDKIYQKYFLKMIVGSCPIVIQLE